MMADITSAVECGTVDEILAIVDRLRRLPEFGMSKAVDQVHSLAEVVCRAELDLALARSALHLDADKLITEVIARWSPDEIAEATGYKVRRR